MKTIRLKLHRDSADCLMLDSQDIYEYIGESTFEEIEFALYIDKWCKYLNYHIGGLHNTNMIIGDSEYSKLDGWLDGYNYAKKYEVTHHAGFVEIKTKKFLVVLERPFEI